MRHNTIKLILKLMGLNIINLELIGCIFKKNHDYIIMNLTAPLEKKALYWKYRFLKFLSCLVGRVAILKNNCFISLVKFLFGVFWQSRHIPS